MSKTERKGGNQGGDQKVKISESTLKDIIKKEIKRYLEETSTVSAIQGPPGPFRGGDDEDESEDTTQPIIRRGLENARK